VLNVIFLIFTALHVIFFVFTLYNVPVVATGFWRFWSSRRKDTENIQNEEPNLPLVSIIIPVKNEKKVIKYASEVRTSEESPFNVRSLLAQRARWYRRNIEVGLRFGRLMKRPNLRKFDAEITLFGTFIIMLFALNYFAPFCAFLATPTVGTILFAQFTSFATLLSLVLVGVSLVFMERPFRVSNLLRLPFIFAYWGFQSVIAVYALIEIVLRRKRRWRKTEHLGLITGDLEKSLQRV